jgi:ubiquinone/menaquinone biosynthesis C-methylase UbiE
MTTHGPPPDHGGHGRGHAGHGDHAGAGQRRDKFNPANVERLLGEERRAWNPPEATLRAAGVAPDQTVVDLGCGPGYYTLPAAELVGPRGTVYGVDVQPEMVAACRERAAAAGARGVEVVRSSETHVPLPDGVADLVLASLVLHEATDRAAFLREARRLLKPGGEVALIEFRQQDGPPGPPRAVRLSEADVAAAAGAAGLRVRERRALNDHQLLFHLAAT